MPDHSPARDRIARLHAKGMVSGYGERDIVESARQSGGDEYAGAISAVVQRRAALDGARQAVQEIDAGIRDDFAAMVEAQEIAASAQALVERIRRRYP